ncbi:MAG: aminopeptidase [Acidobacteria bacterium]|nr:aminopeptidase [Acidobacteriota bacterium]
MVGEEGTYRWLREKAGSLLLDKWETERHRQQDFLKLVTSTRARLQQLYAIPVSEPDKRRAKLEIFRQAGVEYAVLKRSWGGHAGYDAWFAELNNAKLAAVSTYHAGVPALRRLLSSVDDDLPRFYTEVEKIAAWPAQRRRSWLAKGGEDKHG